MGKVILKGSIALGLFIALLALTTVDLSISQKFVNQESSFGILFKHIGEFPVMVFPAMFAVVCFFAYPRLRAIALIVLPICNYLWLEMLFSLSDLEGASQTIFLVTMSVLVSAIMLLGFWRIPEPIRTRMILPLLFAVIFIVASAVCVQVLKILWGRIRFVNLADPAEFTAWHSPNGINGHKSFPSGHTSASCSLLSVFLFIKQFKMPKPLAITLSIFSIGFILCTAVSRVILGAHYSTDVTFSMLLCYLILLLCLKLMKHASE